MCTEDWMITTCYQVVLVKRVLVTYHVQKTRLFECTETNTAWPQQKNLSGTAALSLSNFAIYIQSMRLNDPPNEPSQI